MVASYRMRQKIVVPDVVLAMTNIVMRIIYVITFLRMMKSADYIIGLIQFLQLGGKRRNMISQNMLRSLLPLFWASLEDCYLGLAACLLFLIPLPIWLPSLPCCHGSGASIDEKTVTPTGEVEMKVVPPATPMLELFMQMWQASSVTGLLNMST